MDRPRGHGQEGTRAQLAGWDRLDRSAPTPLWRQLARDLGGRLDRGEFTDAFPGEIELGEQYAVSRHTVREALRQLRAEGAISTGRGRRPRIAAPEPVIAQPTGIVYSGCSGPWSPAASPRSPWCAPSTCVPTG